MSVAKLSVHIVLILYRLMKHPGKKDVLNGTELSLSTDIWLILVKINSTVSIVIYLSYLQESI